MKSAANKSAPIVIENLRERDAVRFGQTIPGRVAEGHNAAIVVGSSIRLYGLEKNRYVKDADGKYVPGEFAYDRTFAVGDVAEYDSYNMHFTGTIAAIGAKTVTIQDGKKTTRLSIFEFAWRNRHLDLTAIDARNADVMMHC
jgi:hypothetical protein